MRRRRYQLPPVSTGLGQEIGELLAVILFPRSVELLDLGIDSNRANERNYTHRQRYDRFPMVD